MDGSAAAFSMLFTVKLIGCASQLILLTQKHLVSIKNLCLQNDFCEEFDAVAAANAGKPVMLTGE